MTDTKYLAVAPPGPRYRRAVPFLLPCALVTGAPGGFLGSDSAGDLAAARLLPPKTAGG